MVFGQMTILSQKSFYGISVKTIDNSEVFRYTSFKEAMA